MAAESGPTTLGRYVELHLLGEGGMGAVYRARDPALDRQVAIKIMHQSTPEFLLRFHREARAIARLSHANIVQVYDFGEDPSGAPYFVMELCPGKSLEEVLRERGALPPQMVADLLRQAAQGLAAAHDKGIVHRDIKPANLLLEDSGTLKLLDFGIVHMEEGENALTKPAALMGTPHYMSPEMLNGQKLDGRADLYALGLVAFHLLAGKPPFTAPSAVAVAMKHLSEPLPDLMQMAPRTPPGLWALVQRLAQKDPAKRVQSAAELLKELDALDLSGPAPGRGARRAALAGGALVVAAGAALLAVVLVHGGQHHVGGGADLGQGQGQGKSGQTIAGEPPPGPDLQKKPDPPAADQQGAAQAAAPLALGRDGRLRVAVLKFKNLGSEHDLDLLTEGIGETIVTTLGQMGRLRLIERNQVDQALGEIDFGQTKYVDKATAAALGHITGAQVAVQGGYQRAGGALRVTARLVRIETGEILDTLVITGPAAGLFDMQDKVAAELQRHLLSLLHEAK